MRASIVRSVPKATASVRGKKAGGGGRRGGDGEEEGNTSGEGEEEEEKRKKAGWQCWGSSFVTTQ